MTKNELKDKIKSIVKTIYPDFKLGNMSEYEDEKLFNLPQLREIVVELLTIYYPNFVERTDWVSPKPMTFRLNLKNGSFFYLIYNNPSWSAEVNSKRYNLSNNSEKMSCMKNISKLLRTNVNKTVAKDEE